MKPVGSRDFRDLIVNGKAPPSAIDPQKRWWALEGKEAAASICAQVGLLRDAQSNRIRQQIISARLYGQQNLAGGASAAFSRLQAGSSSTAQNRMTFNAVQSIIDTVTAKVGENKPRPYYLTSGGSYSEQKRAKKANQFVEGAFYETQTYDQGLDCFRDGAIWGDGILQVCARGGKLHHERTLSSELWVDEEEAAFGAPRRMYKVRDWDRELLAAAVSNDPKAVKAVMMASKSVDASALRSGDTNDLVKVVEAWNLPALTQDGELIGGKYAMVLDSGSDGGSQTVLLGNDGELQDYKYPCFPFARIPWCKRPFGFWSQGLAEQLAGQQIEVNKLLWFIQRAMQMAGGVKVLVQKGSTVSKEHISNEIGGIIEYVGAVPTFVCPDPINVAFYEQLNQQIQRMYEVSGASQLSAASKKPSGLDSGEAIRMTQDIESDRFRTTSRYNDNFYTGVAKLDMMVAEDLKGYKVRVPGKNSFQQVDFKKDVGSLKNSEMVLQCYPVSRLPRDPAGRLQTIQDYAKAGFITPRQAKRLLDFPDLDSLESLQNAQEDLITRNLDAILEDGEYHAPEPTDDLAASMEISIEYIQRSRLYDDIEPEKIALLRKYKSQVETLAKKAMTPAANTNQLPPGGTPQGVAPKAPVSNLMAQAA